MRSSRHLTKVWSGCSVARYSSSAAITGFSATEELADLRLRVGRAHQRFADQHGVDADREHRFDVGARGHAALPYQRHAVGHRRAHLLNDGGINLERREVARVD